MGIIGGRLGYFILKSLAPQKQLDLVDQDAKSSELELEQVFGYDFFHTIVDKTVIDFGCGNGDQAVEMAKKSMTTNVIGLDIREKYLDQGRQKASELAVADRCKFSSTTEKKADIIISKDAFEHFSNPLDILETMRKLLKPDGYVLASFGPTWLHPYGGHLFSVFPWSHLLFTERSQILWRSDFKTDGATKFSEVDGGLNQITIGKFEAIVRRSAFSLEWLETIPIKGIQILKSKILREFGTSLVRCKLCMKEHS